MKHAAMILIGLLFLLACSSAYSQSLVLVTFYPDGINTALSCPCAGGPALSEGTSVCWFWDRNGNGPDANDSLVTVGSGYGQLTYQCISIGSGGYGAGFFEASEAVVCSQIPSAPDAPNYYLRISSGTCCLHSSILTFSDGFSEYNFTNAQWTCESPACPSNVAPPTAPTNVQATDNTGCLEITVTWQHDGQNVTGYNIYQDDVLASSVGASARLVNILAHDGTHSYYVKAANAGGDSPASNTDQGSTYLLHFAPGAEGDIPTGYGRHGETHTLHFVQPTPTCPSTLWLYLIYRVGFNDPNGTITRGALVGYDSLDTVTDVTFPNDSTKYYCRVLLKDSSWATSEVDYDTTENIFHLGNFTDAEEPTPTLPLEFSLSQNYPNPFNPNTQIEFAVPYQAEVSIQIYNIQGQLVKTLVNGVYTAGIHKVEWNGTNQAGSEIGSGVYLYRMEGPDFVKTQKMLLLK